MRVKNNLARVAGMSKKPNMTEQNLPWLKKYPAGLTWDLEIPSQPLYKLLDDAVEQFSENNCIDFLGKKYTYSATHNSPIWYSSGVSTTERRHPFLLLTVMI